MTTDGTQTKTGVTPGDGKAETPKETPTFTQAQVEKMLRDRETAIKADVGRIRAEAEKAFKAAQEALKRDVERQRLQEEAELEAHRDDPAEMKRIRAEQRSRKAESEAAEVRAQLEEANARLAEREAKDKDKEKESVSREIANRLHVDPARLVKLAKFTDGSAEAIEDLAKDLPKMNTNTGEGFTPDSNTSHGGSAQTENDIRKDYIGGRITAVQRDEKLKAIGARL